MKAILRHHGVVPRRTVFGLGIGWFIIIAKCLAMPWVFARWEIPVDSGWVIVPTLIFALLVTLIVLTHNWTYEDEP